MGIASLKEKMAAAIFFEFKAAFPSIAHKFLLSVLREAGVPDHLMNFFQVLYSNNKCCV